MFKEGDIVTLNDIYGSYYETSISTRDLRQSYVITETVTFMGKNDVWYNLRGLVNNRNVLTINQDYIQLDKSYYRKLKLKKICSNQGMR